MTESMTQRKRIENILRKYDVPEVDIQHCLDAVANEARIDEVEQMRAAALMGIFKNSNTLREYGQERIEALKQEPHQ